MSSSFFIIFLFLLTNGFSMNQPNNFYTITQNPQPMNLIDFHNKFSNIYFFNGINKFNDIINLVNENIFAHEKLTELAIKQQFLWLCIYENNNKNNISCDQWWKVLKILLKSLTYQWAYKNQLDSSIIINSFFSQCNKSKINCGSLWESLNQSIFHTINFFNYQTYNNNYFINNINFLQTNSDYNVFSNIYSQYFGLIDSKILTNGQSVSLLKFYYNNQLFNCPISIQSDQWITSLESNNQRFFVEYNSWKKWINGNNYLNLCHGVNLVGSCSDVLDVPNKFNLINGLPCYDIYDGINCQWKNNNDNNCLPFINLLPIINKNHRLSVIKIKNGQWSKMMITPYEINYKGYINTYNFWKLQLLTYQISYQNSQFKINSYVPIIYQNIIINDNIQLFNITSISILDNILYSNNIINIINNGLYIPSFTPIIYYQCKENYLNDSDFILKIFMDLKLEIIKDYLLNTLNLSRNFPLNIHDLLANKTINNCYSLLNYFSLKKSDNFCCTEILNNLQYWSYNNTLFNENILQNILPYNNIYEYSAYENNFFDTLKFCQQNNSCDQWWSIYYKKFFNENINNDCKNNGIFPITYENFLNLIKNNIVINLDLLTYNNSKPYYWNYEDFYNYINEKKIIFQSIGLDILINNYQCVHWGLVSNTPPKVNYLSWIDNLQKGLVSNHWNQWWDQFLNIYLYTDIFIDEYPNLPNTFNFINNNFNANRFYWGDIVNNFKNFIRVIEEELSDEFHTNNWSVDNINNNLQQLLKNSKNPKVIGLIKKLQWIINENNYYNENLFIKGSVIELKFLRNNIIIYTNGVKNLFYHINNQNIINNSIIEFLSNKIIFHGHYPLPHGQFSCLTSNKFDLSINVFVNYIVIYYLYGCILLICALIKFINYYSNWKMNNRRTKPFIIHYNNYHHSMTIKKIINLTNVSLFICLLEIFLLNQCYQWVPISIITIFGLKLLIHYFLENFLYKYKIFIPLLIILELLGIITIGLDIILW